MNYICNRQLGCHLSTDPPITEENKEMDKQNVRQIRINVRAEMKELFVGWILPIAGMFACAFSFIYLMRYILICIYTLAR